MAQEQLMTAADEADDDAFETMMSALDVFFHVIVCPNHSKEERQDALKEAKKAFAEYVGYDPLTGPDGPSAEEFDTAPEADFGTDDLKTPAPNAPTSKRLH